jgi:hypothetical protein
MAKVTRSLMAGGAAVIFGLAARSPTSNGGIVRAGIADAWQAFDRFRKRKSIPGR